MKDKNNKFTQIAIICIVLIVAFYAMINLLKSNSMSIIVPVLIAIIAAMYIYKKNEKINNTVKKAFQENNKITILVTLILLLYLPFAFRTSPYWIFIFATSWTWVIIALGINVQFGSAGVINLGAAFFWGLGGYTTAMLATRLGVHAVWGIVAGGIIAVLGGLILTIPILKARGHYLALVTLAAVVSLEHAANNIHWIGGSQGISNIPSITIAGHSFLEPLQIMGVTLPSITNFYYFTLILGVIVFLFFYRLYNSWVGLTLNAFSESKGDIISAGCMGINRTKWVAIAFSLGNFFIGVSGAVTAHMNSYIAPPDITLYNSLLFLAAVLIGGMDNVTGVSIAAVLLVILPEKFRVLQEYWILVFMVILVAVIILRPEGLLPFKIRKYGFKGKNEVKGGESLES